MLKYRKNIYFFPARSKQSLFPRPPRSPFSAAFALFSFGLAAEIKQQKRNNQETGGVDNSADRIVNVLGKFDKHLSIFQWKMCGAYYIFMIYSILKYWK